MASEAPVAKPIDISSFKSLLADIASAHPYTAACGTVRVIRHSPILTPSPNSTVRFLPIRDQWRLADFTPFEGGDFAFAITRSMLHRRPSEDELERVTNCARPIDKLSLLLDVYAISQHKPSRTRLTGLLAGRIIYRLFLKTQEWKWCFLSKQLWSVLKRYATRQFTRLDIITEQQQHIYECLDRLDRLEERLQCGS